jgi:lysophospholipase L1-like esterase
MLQHLLRAAARGAAIAAVTVAISGCQLFKGDDSPTGPSTVTPPPPNAAIHYTAVGASDANGVGASVPCVPFSPCDSGTGYVPQLARLLRSGREVDVLNLGIPTAVLSPAIQAIARAAGRDVVANFVDAEVPFVATQATLVTVFGGPNDANALVEAIEKGAAGNDVRGYVNTQIQAFGADYDRVVRGIRARAPNAFIVLMNLPNLAALPYARSYGDDRRRLLQATSAGFSREVNRQAGNGVVVLDLMCDAQVYDPSRFYSDGFHPNDAGYAYLAQRLAAVVNGTPSIPSSSCSQMTVVGGL